MLYRAELHPEGAQKYGTFGSILKFSIALFVAASLFRSLAQVGSDGVVAHRAWHVVVVVCRSACCAWCCKCVVLCSAPERTPPESACSAGGAALARLGAFGIGALCARWRGIVSSRTDRPQVAVVVDNSASMRIRDNRFDRSAVARAVVEGIRSAFPADAVLPLRVGRTVETLPALVRDSFRFDDGATNLEAPFAVLAQRRTENVQAVVLITDGAYNTGGMPLYEALSLGKPVFTVGIGDTAAVKDAAITALVTNERGYKGVEMPVQVSVTADGLEGVATLVLSDGGVEVGRAQIRLQPAQRFYRHVFSYLPTSEGIHKLTARLEPPEGTSELTTLNNVRSEYVKILPNERTIVLIAGSPSPDLALVSTIISSDRSIRLRQFVQKFGAEFYGAAPTAADLRNAESIILVGFPIASSPDALITMIADEARRGKPILFIASQTIDPRKLSVLEPVLPFAIERWGSAEMQVAPVLTESGTQHALLATATNKSQRKKPGTVCRRSIVRRRSLRQNQVPRCSQRLQLAQRDLMSRSSLPGQVAGNVPLRCSAMASTVGSSSEKAATAPKENSHLASSMRF